MNIIFISTTRENLQNLTALNFQNSFKDENGEASFTYSQISDTSGNITTVFLVSSELDIFFRSRPDVIYEDERFDSLRRFIEEKVGELSQNNDLGKSYKSYYAFHSHYDIFDDETFNGRSRNLSDDSHIVWGFSHQETDEIFKKLSSNSDLSDITNGLMKIMNGNVQP